MATTSITCRKKHFGCAENVYSFQIGVKAYPDKEVVNVGDTIWFEVNELTTLKDLPSGRIINYSGAENLGSAISIIEFPQKDSVRDAINDFNFILKKGIHVDNPLINKVREYLFVEENNTYLFKLGITPKKNGIYGLVFSSAANVYRKSDRCTKASFAINFKETNQHYPLNPNFQGGPTPVGGDYYFKVN